MVYRVEELMPLLVVLMGTEESTRNTLNQLAEQGRITAVPESNDIQVEFDVVERRQEINRRANPTRRAE